MRQIYPHKLKPQKLSTTQERFLQKLSKQKKCLFFVYNKKVQSLCAASVTLSFNDGGRLLLNTPLLAGDAPWDWVWGFKLFRTSPAASPNFCLFEEWTVIFSFYLSTFSNILSNRFNISFSILFKYYFFIHCLFFF